MTGNRPEKVFRAGGIRAALWKNLVANKHTGKQEERFLIQIDKTYKVGEDYKTTTHYDVRDLPKVQLVATKAFEWLSLNGDEDGGDR